MSGEVLNHLGICVVTGALFALLGRQLRMPSIVAYLLAGVVLGPVTGLVHFSPEDQLISKVGIVLLLFIVGLELSFDKIRGIGRVAVLAGLGQIVFTALGGLGLGRLLGFGWTEALFLAAALTFSSTVVVVKLLQEQNALDALHGRIAVGVLLMQDIVAVLMLTILTGLDPTAAFSWSAIARGLIGAFGGTLLVVAVVLAATRWVLPRLLRWATGAPETMFILSLSWCFLIVLLAQVLGVSVELGAFFAGLGLAQFPFNADLRRRVHPLMNFCIALFFVSLGVEMTFDGGWVAAGRIAALALFVLVGKAALLWLVIARLGFSRRTSFRAGITLAQISEFSFILVTMGFSAGFYDRGILSLTALVGLVTITGSAYLIRYGDKLFHWAQGWRLLNWLPHHPVEPEEATGAKRQGHVIVVGMNTLGRELVRRLHARGERVLAVDTDPRKFADLPGESMTGSVEYTSVLRAAGLEHARLLVSALKIEEVNDLLAYRASCHGVPCAINVTDLNAVDHLLAVNTTYLIVPKVDGVKGQQRELEKRGLLPAP
ncbi:MAG: cation:proton antiporter [Opitutaceae bacterium]